jgi:drug/metabolite transporter (DMT)-like permease
VFSYIFLKERMNSKTIFSLIMGIAGVGFIVGADILSVLSRSNLLGDALALVSAIAYAGFLIYSRKRAQLKVDIYYAVFWSYAIATIFVLPLNLAYGGFAIPPASIIWILLLAFVCTNISFILLSEGFEHIEAAKGSIAAMSEQIFVAINAFIFFGQELAPLALIGAILIFSSVVIMEL